jgi:predicted phosphohydrolase
MGLFVIADPHLSLGVDKPMGIFGGHWDRHDDKLKKNWLEAVSETDTVVLPGDISWAMNLDEAQLDLEFLDQLPGQKILSRGNHDYWWTSLRKMEKFCRDNRLDSLSFMRNNALAVDNNLVCGTRGWILPDDPDFSGRDEKILNREAARLRLSLEEAEKIRKSNHRIIVCLHYPPLTKNLGQTTLTDLMTSFGVDICCYGHIHGPDTRLALSGEKINGISYWLASADQIGFKPLRL